MDGVGELATSCVRAGAGKINLGNAMRTFDKKREEEEEEAEQEAETPPHHVKRTTRGEGGSAETRT